MHLQGDMHTHTIASTHAYSTITENCEWAAKYGMKGIAMTDHAMNMPDSPHIWHFVIYIPASAVAAWLCALL